MIVAVPLELVASPLRSGRGLGEADRSALVVGGTERVRAGGAVVFCKVVAVAEAQVKRDGQVRAKGSPVHHATLGPLEERLEPGAVGEVAGSARLDGRLVKGERERLLARAFMVRVIVLMTLMPDARVQDVIAALAGDLALVPWARPWRPASARAAVPASTPASKDLRRPLNARTDLARELSWPGTGRSRSEQSMPNRSICANATKMKRRARTVCVSKP